MQILPFFHKNVFFISYFLRQMAFLSFNNLANNVIKLDIIIMESGFPSSVKCWELLSGQFYFRLEHMKICNFQLSECFLLPENLFDLFFFYVN